MITRSKNAKHRIFLKTPSDLKMFRRRDGMCGYYAIAILLQWKYCDTINWGTKRFKKNSLLTKELVTFLQENNMEAREIPGYNGIDLKLVARKLSAYRMCLVCTSDHAVCCSYGRMNERNYDGWIRPEEYRKRKRVESVFVITRVVDDDYSTRLI